MQFFLDKQLKISPLDDQFQLFHSKSTSFKRKEKQRGVLGDLKEIVLKVHVLLDITEINYKGWKVEIELILM